MDSFPQIHYLGKNCKIYKYTEYIMVKEFLMNPFSYTTATMNDIRGNYSGCKVVMDITVSANSRQSHTYNYVYTYLMVHKRVCTHKIHTNM